jgi:hypothetical protein
MKRLRPFEASAQPAQNAANQNQRKPDQNPLSTATPTTTPQGQPPTESPHAGSPDNHRQDSQQSSYDYSALFTSWIQAVIAILLFVWVVRQTRIANQQQKIMQKQIDLYETIERGFIGIGDMQITNLVVGSRPTVIIKWINGGRTPVQNFRANPTVIFGKEPTTNKIGRIDDDVSPISTSFFPVGAEREVKYEQTNPVSEADFNAFQTGSVNIYIVGNFIYRDMNGQTHRGGISAMHDIVDEFVYETYEYTNPDQNYQFAKPT